jgi:putative phage-type endonuclease
MKQGSDEWLAARVGLVTASRVPDVIAKTKTGPSASRAGYLGELVAERLTGQSAEGGFMNDDMRRGLELEPEARMAYEIRTGRIVEEVGLVLHPTMRAGASPDGLVDDGLLEIKCPRTHVHIEYLLAGKPPSKYLPQMAWQCICTGRAWCDFVSFDPKMPEALRLFVVRYTPDAGYLRELEAEVEAFIGEVDAKVEQLGKLAA